MPQLGVQRAIRRLYCRDEDQHLAFRQDHVAEHAQGRHIVVNVLEHVDAVNGVEAMRGELRRIAVLEVTGAQRELRLVAHRDLDPLDAVAVRFDPDDFVRDAGQLAAHRADAAPDLEHARADVRPEQVEDMRAVPTRFLDRLEILGGVAILCLIESAIDVFHVSRGTVPYGDL